MSPQLKLYLLDPLERAGSTFLEQFLIVLLATGTGGLLVTQNFLAAADAGLFAAILAVLTSYVLLLTGFSLHGWVDVARRIGLTFLQSMLGTLAASTFSHSVVHADWRSALALALNVTAAAALKIMAAQALPTIGGSVLVPAALVDDAYVVHSIDASDLDYGPMPLDEGVGAHAAPDQP